MNKTVKIAIVAVLVVAVVVVIAMKQRENRSSAAGQSDQSTVADSGAGRTDSNDSNASKKTVAVADKAVVADTSGEPKQQSDKADSKLPVLLDLGAGKCLQCKMMEPVLNELKKEYAGELTVKYIDIHKNSEAIKKYRVRVIPTQIFFDAAGKELFRHEGFFPKGDIVEKWKQLGVALDTKGK